MFLRTCCQNNIFYEKIKMTTKGPFVVEPFLTIGSFDYDCNHKENLLGSQIPNKPKSYLKEGNLNVGPSLIFTYLKSILINSYFYLFISFSHLGLTIHVKIQPIHLDCFINHITFRSSSTV